MEYCQPGNRYRFYRNNNTFFEATFVEILRDTLLVSNYSDENGPCYGLLRSIPTSWIVKTESLYETIWGFEKQNPLP